MSRDHVRRSGEQIVWLANQEYYRELWLRWDKQDFSAPVKTLDEVLEEVAQESGFEPSEFKAPQPTRWEKSGARSRRQ